MIVLEIIMIFIGLAAVALSFKISDYGSDSNGSLSQDGNGEGQQRLPMTQESRESFVDELENIKEETIQTASDELSRLSNEKLMGMDEYTSQVLEKIAKNHEEVVFLYNMLGEKEDEIKKLVHHVDSVKAQMHEEVAGEYQKMAQVLKLLEKKKAKVEKSIREQESLVEHGRSSVSVGHKREELNAAYDKEVRAIEEAEGDVQQQQYFPKVSKEKEDQAVSQSNQNDKIIDLYKKEHSILEISRMLSMGQGEVKFVIDLYENRKKRI